VRYLLLNQTFHPDVASTAQHLKDLALGLVRQGHEVTVVTSRRAYENPRVTFGKVETWCGVRVHRVASTGFGKGAKWRRVADFASFVLSCSLRLPFLPKQDAVVALTTPPLISFIGALVSRFWGASFFYWVMDLNPDEAIAAGWLRVGSPVARLLDAMSRFSLNQAAKIIALDRFMSRLITAKGISPSKIVVIPPWPHDDEVRSDPAGREQFREAHGLEGKVVVMYSGNHSPVHPLDTLWEAADQLRGERDIVFCFVGGGSEWRKIKEKINGSSQGARGGMLENIVCLPYQPLGQLGGSLSAADLHVVVMGDAMVGLVHPCKIYNILNVGVPILYIGPSPSHITDMLGVEDADSYGWAAHGQVDAVVAQLRRLLSRVRNKKAVRAPSMPPGFKKDELMGRMIAVLEGCPK